MSLNPSILLLLLAAVAAHAITQSGNSQAALDNNTQGQGSFTSPAELVAVSAENLRFSRLLKDTANVLQFSSISNDAPPIWGIQRDGKKESSKEKKGSRKGHSGSGSGPSFGRRALDYDEHVSVGLEESTSESKIVANPYPGNEYVFVRPGKLEQRFEEPVEQEREVDHAASVTTINNKPPRVPLAILRQKKGKRVNITPLFTEVPDVVQHNVAKEFVFVDQPQGKVVGVNRKGRKHADVEEYTTNPAFGDDDIEATTTLVDDLPVETTTLREVPKQKTIVNIVTSEPRFSVESSVGERRKSSRRLKAATAASTTSTTTSTSTTTAASTTSTSTSTTTEAVPETTTIAASTSTFRVPPTTVPRVVLSSSSARAIASADLKENLVTDAFHRPGTTFHGFHDNSQTKLQTAESSQPARVNVRPAQNGKEYEYEYIYYYYDDDEEGGAGGGEKRGEAQVKAVEQNKENIVKQVSPPGTSTSTTTLSTPGSSSSSSVPASSTTVTTSSSTSTTSTTTLSPVLSSDADFEYDDDAVLDGDDDKFGSPLPEIQKSTPLASRTTDEPIINKGVSSAEKLSNSNPINQLDRSRGPKILPGKFEEAVADYKLETEASQEEAVQSHVLSRGQPQRPLTTATTSSEEDEENAGAPAPVFHVSSREPSTSSPAAGTTSEFDISHMSTLAKTHKDSINTPIILKQSSLLKSVPVSQLQPHQEQEQPQHQTTVYTVTPVPSTTTTVEASSEPAPSSTRGGSPRLRGQHRLRGSVTPRPSSANSEQKPVQTTEEKPAQAVHRPNLRGSNRRIPSRRPPQEAAETAPEQQPAASPIIEAHARPLPIRPRFPPRTQGHQTTTVAAPASETDAPVVAAVTVSAAELNSLEDKRAKDAHVRAKSANDLLAFARLQQAISSRAPSRIPPKLVGGFVNSGEVTTEAITSSEVTTVTSFGGHSVETVSDEPSTTTTTTTTTTTEAVQLDKFGRPRGRFGGRTRRPLGGGAGSPSSTTTESPTTSRGRFGGGRRRTSTTEAPAGESSQQTSSTNAESPKPRIPSRNRFASRNRGSTTTAEPAVTAEGQKPTESERPSPPAAAPGARRRPGAFGGRRRPNHLQTAQTDAPASTSAVTQEDTNPTSGDTASTPAATTTAAPATPGGGRNRFNFPPGGRPRPGAGGGNNPVRIRGGGRLRGPTSTTTEAAPEETQPEVQAQDADEPQQSQSIQSENVEQPVSPPAQESVVPIRGGGGVLGRLKNRPKLVVTTTPPETNTKPRLNGLLNRRKNLGQLAAAAHIKEEVRESVSEGGEEANNHALELTDDHKGVVVQVSSSITESEEVNETAGEVLEPSSTTPASILNRLKSQRKPGSLFRKKPDPHGE